MRLPLSPEEETSPAIKTIKTPIITINKFTKRTAISTLFAHLGKKDN
jgi:hypothetical protein